MEHKWWQSGVIYQVYPRSFQDSNGDGIGDLRGIANRLDYFVDLGIDALWLSPFYKSPMRDFGYDVSDYCAVDPIFGDLSDFRFLIQQAHARNIKLIIDVVPNHTSDEHQWFQKARADRNSSYRDWYVWHDAKADGSPPNNWRSFFGGPAWSWDERTNQYYLHHFLPSQPDLNYRKPEVVQAMLDVMRFWLELGVDGFRMDVLWMLVEEASFADEPLNSDWIEGMPENELTTGIHRENQPETYEVVAAMRALLDEYSKDGVEKVMIGEIYQPNEVLVSYYGTREKPLCHLPFNFSLLMRGLTNWCPENVSQIIREYENALPPQAWPNWVLGNHDRTRLATRLGPEQARVATLLLFTLRGTPTWYYGDEIGMQDVFIPSHQQCDPFGLRQPGVIGAARDFVRTPMQWDGSDYSGFSTSTPWLPQSPDFSVNNVEAQLLEPSSMLVLLKKILAVRRQYDALTHGSLCDISHGDGTLSFSRQHENSKLFIELNMTDKLSRRSTKGQILLSTYSDEGSLNDVQLLRPNEGIIVFKQ